MRRRRKSDPRGVWRLTRPTPAIDPLLAIPPGLAESARAPDGYKFVRRPPQHPGVYHKIPGSRDIVNLCDLSTISMVGKHLLSQIFSHGVFTIKGLVLALRDSDRPYDLLKSMLRNKSAGKVQINRGVENKEYVVRPFNSRALKEVLAVVRAISEGRHEDTLGACKGLYRDYNDDVRMHYNQLRPHCEALSATMDKAFEEDAVFSGVAPERGEVPVVDMDDSDDGSTGASVGEQHVAVEPLTMPDDMIDGLTDEMLAKAARDMEMQIEAVETLPVGNGSDNDNDNDGFE